ncbi:MAG TPA: Uma2 family endonuclease [Planctomycetota bacterium]|nr:Uma2 family endonuclease [Planctomycetota bacterium]
MRHPGRITVDEFMRRPENAREELIDGEIIVTWPTLFHAVVSTRLTMALYAHVEARQLGLVLGQGVGVFLTEFDAFGPDALFLSNDRMSRKAREGIRGAPDLVTEVLSPSTRKHDLGHKRKTYAEQGVAEYWVIDLDARSVLVYRFGERADDPVRTLRVDDLLTTDLLPGFSLSLRTLFREP